MSNERLSYNGAKDHRTLYDLNLLGLWCGCPTGSEWTSIIRTESLAATNQPVEQRKSGSTRGIAFLVALATLTLLVAATLTQAPVASRIPQENVKAVLIK